MKIKDIFLQLIVLFVLVSCQRETGNVDDPGWDDKDTDSNRITVMTYNLRYCTPYLVENATPDIDAIAAVINKAKPDVVMVQEVDRYTRRSQNVDQLAELSKKTNMQFSFFGKSQDYQDGDFGCALLSRYSLSDPQKTVYPRVEGQTNDRVMVQATIRFNDKLLTVACTHFGTTQSEQDAEAPVANSILSASLYPIIFGGDLNAIPENKTITGLLENGFVKTNTLTTWTIPSNQPNRQLDYIMYRPADKFKVISHTVLPDRVSDHLAVVAVLELQ